jgi:hypothetical protein
MEYLTPVIANNKQITYKEGEYTWEREKACRGDVAAR